MKTKRFLAAILAVMMLVSTFAFSASAKNNTDVDFRFDFNTGSIVKNSAAASRLKEDSSASYVNYANTTSGATSTGPYKIQVWVYGSTNYTTGFVDCTSYTYDGYARTPAIVTRGTRGLVRQDVWENYYPTVCWGQLYARSYLKYDNESNIATGCWSVDSVGSYPYYNAVA